MHKLAEKNIEKYEKLLSLEKKHQMTMPSIHIATQATSFVAPSQSEATTGSQDDQSVSEAQKPVNEESDEASV